MKLRYSFLFITFCLLNVSCQENKTQEPSIEEKPLDQVVFLVSNETNSPISFDLMNLSDRFIIREMDEWVTTYNSKDTIVIDLFSPTSVEIHSLEDYKQTLYVSPGDTITVDLKTSKMNLASTDRLAFNDFMGIETAKDKKLDSLYALVIETDSTRALKGRNELSIMNLVPISFKKEILEDPENLEQIVSALLNELSFEKDLTLEVLNDDQKYMSTFKSDLLKKEIFLKLNFIARQTQSKPIQHRIYSTDFFQSEQFAQSPYVQTYLMSLIKDYILEGKEDRSKRMSYIDYKEAFDQLPKYMDGKVLKYAQELSLWQMTTYNEDKAQINQYLDKYLQTYQDSNFVAMFRTKYLIYEELVNESNLQMVDLSFSQLLGMGDIISSTRSDLIYVDFWASWCPPCRDAMPFSLALKNSLKDQNILFLYISLDRNRKHWELASQSLNLSDYPHNYLSLNESGNLLIENELIQEIPRYMILDGNGQVLDPNAPGPKSDQLTALFKKYAEVN